MKTNHIPLVGIIAALLLAAALPATAQNNTNGNYWAGVGAHSAGPNYGANNTALGWYAMYLGNVPANDNTAVGCAALGSFGFGINNVAVGSQALGLLNSTTTNSNNIALGFKAGYNLAAGFNNIHIGNLGVSTDQNIIRIGTPGSHTATYLAGDVYCTALNITSDRDAKERFTPVNAREVLDKVARLPITEWQYKSQSRTQSEVRHIGPMAQDFHEAFSVGPDGKHITTVDADGVALAAIQGLNEKLDETRAENAELKKTVEELKDLIKHLPTRRNGRAK
jgi:hypothetical protein